MGDKKQNEAMMKTVKQVLVVGACVLFVVLMVLSGMGSHWITMFTVTKPGDTVVVDYTLYDTNGIPLLTSNQQVYTAATTKGKDIVLSKPLSVVAGSNLSKSIYPVTIYSTGTGWTKEFALFSTEYDAINRALPGMKAGEQKKIVLPNSSMAQEWTADQLARNNVSISAMFVGDVLAMGVSDNPESENATISFTRLGQITAKTNQSVIVDFGYPYADISIVAINPKS